MQNNKCLLFFEGNIKQQNIVNWKKNDKMLRFISLTWGVGDIKDRLNRLGLDYRDRER